MDDLCRYIHLIPKAELHIHIEGSLEPELLFQLAKRNNISIPYMAIEDVHDELSQFREGGSSAHTTLI